jgi:hypothetical protein
MSLFKEVLSGYSARIRLNNSLELQKAKLVRPSQIKMEIAVIKTAIANELKENAELKAQYDDIKLEVPA